MSLSSVPYVIRLRGPWHIEPLARTVLLHDGTTQAEPGSLPPAARTGVPSDWGAALGTDFRGRVRYTRRFGRPSNLAADQRVTLVIEAVDWTGEVTLNGERLGTLRFGEPAARFEVRSYLDFRNELVIDVELPEPTAETEHLLNRPGREGMPGGLIGEVRLEIQ